MSRFHFRMVSTDTADCHVVATFHDREREQSVEITRTGETLTLGLSEGQAGMQISLTAEQAWQVGRELLWQVALAMCRGRRSLSQQVIEQARPGKAA